MFGFLKKNKKKKTFWEKMGDAWKKADKKVLKYNKKITKRRIKNRKLFYRQLVLAPKLIDVIINVLFFLIVFTLFFIKAKNPKFLDGIFPEDD